MQYTRDAAEKIIGDAAKADSEARERLTQAEIEDAAAGVGIGRDAVRSVIARETELTAQSEARHRAIVARLRAVALVVLGCVAVSAFCGLTLAWWSYRDVSTAHSRVEAARHNVTLALDNRSLVSRALDTAINVGERATVLERAERRISVAKRDYNNAVEAYNSTTTGWFGSRARRSANLPAAEPYADNVWR